MEKSEYRKALGEFMTGVTIVTALDEEGEPWGVTANSFTSVSLEPPIILVCLGRKGRAWPTFAAAERFAINILSAEQQDLAAHFAGSTENRFTKIEWTRDNNNAPLLPSSAVWLDCKMREQIEAADHTILLGDVLGFQHSPQPPLGYHRGAFITPSNAETQDV